MLYRSILCALLLAACSNDGAGPGGSADAAAASDAEAVVAVPSEPDALFAFLAARSYTGFQAESAPHVSAGPHGGTVRTFLNPALHASLGLGGPHPVGAAAVKELFEDGTLSGWAVSVKIAAGESGDAWYWYEVFNTNTNTGTIEGVGKSLCVGCHEEGVDFVHTPFPLQ